MKTNQSGSTGGAGRVLLATVAVIGLSAAGAGAAAAGTYSLITPYSGANTSTAVLGINDSGYMTGAINNTTDGSSQGFLLTPTGTYTPFSDGFGTVGRAIASNNTISGYATDSTENLVTDTQFQRSPGGTLTPVVNPTTSAPLNGIAQGMNDSGALVGDYYTPISSGVRRDGYILQGSSFTDLQAPGQHSTVARGIDNAGTVVGWSSGVGGIQGYIYSGGVFNFISDPAAGSQGTYIEGINLNGTLAVGEWIDALGDNNPFVLNLKTDTFTNITIPGETNVDAFGVNDLGQIVLSGQDTGNNYLYNAGVPEPSTWAMLMLGVAGMGLVLRRRPRTRAVCA